MPVRAERRQFLLRPEEDRGVLRDRVGVRGGGEEEEARGGAEECQGERGREDERGGPLVVCLRLHLFLFFSFSFKRHRYAIFDLSIEVGKKEAL